MELNSCWIRSYRPESITSGASDNEDDEVEDVDESTEWRRFASANDDDEDDDDEDDDDDRKDVDDDDFDSPDRIKSKLLSSTRIGATLGRGV